METWLKATILDSLPLDKHFDSKFCMYDSDDEEEFMKRMAERKMEAKKMEQKKRIAAQKSAEIKQERGMGGFSELVGASTGGSSSASNNMERGRQLSQRLRNSGASDLMQKCNLTGAPRGSSSLLLRKKKKKEEEMQQSAKIAMSSAKQKERAENPVLVEEGADGEVIMFGRDWEPAGLKNGGSSVSMDDFINDSSRRSGVLTRRSDRPIGPLTANSGPPTLGGGGGLRARKEKKKEAAAPWFQGCVQWPKAMQQQGNDQTPHNPDPTSTSTSTSTSTITITSNSTSNSNSNSSNSTSTSNPSARNEEDGEDDADIGDTPVITYGVMLQPNQEIEGMNPNQELLQAVQESMDSYKPKLRSLTEKQMSREVREEDVEESDKQLECAVCMGDFDLGEKKVTLPCTHIFHAGCIRSWLSKNAICPHCRYEVGKDDERSMGSSLLKNKKKKVQEKK